jgi:hypothetical protein
MTRHVAVAARIRSSAPVPEVLIACFLRNKQQLPVLIAFDVVGPPSAIVRIQEMTCSICLAEMTNGGHGMKRANSALKDV